MSVAQHGPAQSATVNATLLGIVLGAAHDMAVPALDGVVCRLLLLTALSFNTWNNVTLEFSTPRSSAGSSQLLCFNDTGFRMQRVVLYTLIEGGTLFDPSPQPDLMAGYTPLDSAVRSTLTSNLPFFFTGGLLDPLVAPVSVPEALGTDPYYASSYLNTRHVYVRG